MRKYYLLMKLEWEKSLSLLILLLGKHSKNKQKQLKFKKGNKLKFILKPKKQQKANSIEHIFLKDQQKN